MTLVQLLLPDTWSEGFTWGPRVGQEKHCAGEKRVRVNASSSNRLSGRIPFTGVTPHFWLSLPPVLYISSADPGFLALLLSHPTVPSCSSILRPTNIPLLYSCILNWRREIRWGEGGGRVLGTGIQVHNRDRYWAGPRLWGRRAEVEEVQ